ncbi:MAG: YesL family protein [Eubacteriales bacterium]
MIRKKAKEMLGKFFDLDNGLFRFLGRMGDIIGLNILFVITSIPIITIGAGVTAMYDVSFRMIKNEESYIVKGYFSAMKSNFKKSTLMWLSIAALYIILLMDIKVSNVYTSTIWSIAHYLLVLVFIILCMVASYVFALQAKYENTYFQTLKTALLMSIRYLPTTVMILIFNAILPFCMIWSNATLFHGMIAYAFFGFALVTFINSVILSRLFEKHFK